MAALIYSRGFFRTAKLVPAGLQRALDATVETLETAAALPGPGDVLAPMPPVAKAWRRRVGASAWWVYYQFDGDRVVVVAVAVPP